MAIIIPSSPNDKQKLKSAMNELDGAMTRIAAERDFVKETIARLSEELEVPKSILRKAVSAYHKRDLTNLKLELDDIESLYELVTE